MPIRDSVSEITDRGPTRRRVLENAAKTTFALAGGRLVLPRAARAATLNPVAAENSANPGQPPAQWDIPAAGMSFKLGDPSLCGFATAISANLGETVHFKTDGTYKPHRIDIYRLGYYGGNGACLKASVSAAQVAQPTALFDPDTGGAHCRNWVETAQWTVPANMVSGVYVGKIVDTTNPNGPGAHMVFIVRDDARKADIVLQTADATWQAYNWWGGTNGRSTYGLVAENFADYGNRAFGGSYDRPFANRSRPPSWGYGANTFLFGPEICAIRFLERQGYDVKYIPSAAIDQYGAGILNGKVFMSAGHDEYWSAPQRTGVEQALARGVNLMFLSGNTMYWKIYYDSLRRLVCYKDTLNNGKIAPAGSPWTGTWRDLRYQPADARPEIALLGQQTGAIADPTVAGGIMVPPNLSLHDLWANTSIYGAGGELKNSKNTLIYEWNTFPYSDDPYLSKLPSKIQQLSSANYWAPQVLADEGSTWPAAVAQHSITLYRAPSGAFVFNTGTTQWPLMLDAFWKDYTDDGNPWPLPGQTPSTAAAVSLDAQQVTRNALDLCGVLPATDVILQPFPATLVNHINLSFN